MFCLLDTRCISTLLNSCRTRRANRAHKVATIDVLNGRCAMTHFRGGGPTECLTVIYVRLHVTGRYSRANCITPAIGHSLAEANPIARICAYGALLLLPPLPLRLRFGRHGREAQSHESRWRAAVFQSSASRESTG